MGSQLRKLRIRAGATTKQYQRAHGYPASRTRLEFQDGNVIVATNSKGGRLASSEELRAKLQPLPPKPVTVEMQLGSEKALATFNADNVSAASMIAAAGPHLGAELVARSIERDERHARVRIILGDAEAAAALCETIEEYGRYLGHQSTRPNSELCDEAWEQALREISRGDAPADLTASRWKAAQASEQPARPKTRRSVALLATVATLAMLADLPGRGAR